jgi:hypothetical protein
LHAFHPILNAAIEHANRGWPVFPCDSATKKPYTPNGFKDASTDVNQIMNWWSKYPNAMIGARTGAASGVWVLDIDVKQDANGPAELAKLEQTNGALPATLIASTPSGGKHYYFTHADGIRNRGSFEPGIDVRGEGGYVIAPGSVRDDGCYYDWESRGTDVATAPEWLLDMVIAPKAKPRTGATNSNTSYVDAAIINELQKLIETATNRNNQLND